MQQPALAAMAQEGAPGMAESQPAGPGVPQAVAGGPQVFARGPQVLAGGLPGVAGIPLGVASYATLVAAKLAAAENALMAAEAAAAADFGLPPGKLGRTSETVARLQVLLGLCRAEAEAATAGVEGPPTGQVHVSQTLLRMLRFA